MITIYKIRLQHQNDEYYYVGQTRHFQRRMEQHLERQTGARWIRSKFSRDELRNAETREIFRVNDDVEANVRETMETLELMMQHGANNVRGAEYCKVEDYNCDQIEMIASACVHHLHRVNFGDACLQQLYANTSANAAPAFGAEAGAAVFGSFGMTPNAFGAGARTSTSANAAPAFGAEAGAAVFGSFGQRPAGAVFGSFGQRPAGAAVFGSFGMTPNAFGAGARTSTSASASASANAAPAFGAEAGAAATNFGFSMNSFGFCMNCRENIPHDEEKRNGRYLCGRCCNEWTEGAYEERERERERDREFVYCHGCGLEDGKKHSFGFPRCIDCYRNLTSDY
jgi:hypothetical protein